MGEVARSGVAVGKQSTSAPSSSGYTPTSAGLPHEAAAPVREHDSHASTIQSTRRFVLDDMLVLAHAVLPVSILVLLGRARGWLEYAVRPRARRAVRGNLKRLLGAAATPATVEAATLRFFEAHQARVVLLTLGPMMQAEAKLDSVLSFHGLEHLEGALAGGRGAIILGSHYNSSSQLLMLMELRRRGHDVGVAIPASETPWAPSTVRRWLLARCGAQSFPAATGALHAQFNVRPLVSALRRGTGLLLLGDGWHSASFADATFFGETLPFTTGPLSVARLTGVPVVPVFVQGLPGRQRVTFEEPFRVEGGARDGSVERCVQQYATRLEHHVRDDPALWQHVEVDDLAAHLASLRTRSLQERYSV